MTPAEKERHRTLTAELLRLGPGLIGVVQDAVRRRAFREQRATIVAALDHMADVADGLVPLDKMIVEESQKSRAAVKARAAAEHKALRRQMAAEQAERDKRRRRELEQAALRGSGP